MPSDKRNSPFLGEVFCRAYKGMSGLPELERNVEERAFLLTLVDLSGQKYMSSRDVQRKFMSGVRGTEKNGQWKSRTTR